MMSDKIFHYNIILISVALIIVGITCIIGRGYL